MKAGGEEEGSTQSTVPGPGSGKDLEKVKEGAYGWDARNQGQQAGVMGMECWESPDGGVLFKPYQGFWT